MKYVYGTLAMIAISIVMACIGNYFDIDLKYLAGSFGMLAYLIILTKPYKKDNLNNYIVYQVAIISDDNNNIELENVVRNVVAINENEAIGKFLMSTSHLKFKTRLNPAVSKLDKLIKVF